MPVLFCRLIWRTLSDMKIISAQPVDLRMQCAKFPLAFALRFALCLLACGVPLFPQAVLASTFYKCTDSSGKVLFTNAKQQGDKTKCTALSYYSPSADAASSSSRSRSRQTATPTPADFPRVAGNEQKSRDNDRRAILEKELSTEQAHLDRARKLADTASPQKTPAQRGTVALHERNIQALQKELGNLR